jgi:hypothetical protein
LQYYVTVIIHTTSAGLLLCMFREHT